MAQHHAAPETIGFLLVPDFSMMAFSAAVEPLRLANHISGRELYRWVLVSRDGGTERASNGIVVAVDHGLADAPDLPTVILCSGIGGHWYEDAHVFSWMRRMASRGAGFGSLCTGSHILARAGLLDGYRCTIHWENIAGFTETFPDIQATGELFTVDRNRFTCAGGTAAADMMLHRIHAAHGEVLAIQIAEQLLHDRIRPGSVRQQEAIQPNPGVDREDLLAAILLMQANIEEPVDLLTLSSRLGQSRRNVERLFRRHLNCSPAKYYLALRLKRARQLLSQTRLSVMEVSISCGFVSATHFSKCYRDHFGVPPRNDQHSGRPRPLPPVQQPPALAKAVSPAES